MGWRGVEITKELYPNLWAWAEKEASVRKLIMTDKPIQAEDVIEDELETGLDNHPTIRKVTATIDEKKKIVEEAENSLKGYKK